MGTVSQDQAIATALETIRRVWQELFAAAIDDASLIALASQCAMESGFGRAMRGFGELEWGTNNYGSYQATPDFRAAHARDLGYGEIAYTDSHWSGKTYPATLRIYPSQILAARDWLRLVVSNLRSHGQSLSPVTPEGIGEALGYHGDGSYSETSVAKYTSGVRGWVPKIAASMAKQIMPEDPTIVLGDDFPSNASARVRMFAGLLPGQGGAHAAGIAVGKAPAPQGGASSSLPSSAPASVSGSGPQVPPEGFRSSITDTADLEADELAQTNGAPDDEDTKS